MLLAYMRQALPFKLSATEPHDSDASANTIAFDNKEPPNFTTSTLAENIGPIPSIFGIRQAVWRRDLRQSCEENCSRAGGWATEHPLAVIKVNDK